MRAVAVDCNGVLFSNGNTGVVDSLERLYGYKKRVVKDLLHSEKAMALRRGLITQDQFVLWADDHLPESYDAQLIVNEWHDSHEINPEMLELVVELKIKHKTIVFSSNVRERVKLLEQKYDFLKYFDAHVWSFDHKATKEDDRLYAALIKAAGCPPGEIGLIDDNPDVIEKARSFGMKPFHFRGSVRTLRRMLRDAGFDIVA